MTKNKFRIGLLLVLLAGLLIYFGIAATVGSDETQSDSAGHNYMYVANYTDDTITRFIRDPLKGTLSSPVSYKAAAGGTPWAITADASGSFVYVTSTLTSTLQVFQIGQGGKLTSIQVIDSKDAIIHQPAYIKLDQSTQYILVPVFGVVNGNYYASVYKIESGGMLSQVSTAFAGKNPHSVITEPSEHFAFACDWNGESISQYKFDVTTGALTPNGFVNVKGNGPRVSLFDKSSHFGYVVDERSNNVEVYSLNMSTGTLTWIQTVTSRGGPTDWRAADLKFGPGEKFLYVSSRNDNKVYYWQVDSTTGLLSNMNSIATGVYPQGLEIDPAGKFLYTANMTDGTVSAFKINDGGSLTPVGTYLSGTGKNSGADFTVIVQTKN